MAENYFCILSGAMVLDCFTKKIPNVLIVIGLLNGCFYRILLARAGPVDLIKAVAAILVVFIVSYPLYKLKALGAGDIKLLCVIAAYLGAIVTFKILLSALYFGAILGLISLLFHRNKNKFCFSPAIMLGALVVWEGFI